MVLVKQEMSAISITKSLLSDEAYAEIRRALILGELEPGQRISEPELALRYKTSRSPIREALVRLELEGFVERTPNGRVRVRELDLEELQQLYVVRANVEGLIARLASPRLRTIDLERMEKALDEMEASVKKGDAGGAIASGETFHDLILRECGNKPLIEIQSNLRSKISRYRAVVASLGNYDFDRVTEHRQILKAFYVRKPEQAELEMVRHINRSASVLMSKIKKQK